MTDQESTAVGWRCANCGARVQPNEYHICGAQWPQPESIAPRLDWTQSPELERIAAALERIASALEGK